MGGDTQSRPLARRARAYVQFTTYGQVGQEKILGEKFLRTHPNRNLLQIKFLK